MTEFKKAVAALPPEMQTLLHLAMSKNASVEMQVEAAKSIVDGSPIFALRMFVFHVIQAQAQI